MKSSPNDVAVLGNAKRSFDLMGMLSDAVKILQSIPGKISCFLFGNCEVSNGGNEEGTNNSGEDGDGDDGDDSDSDGEEEDENEDQDDPADR